MIKKTVLLTLLLASMSSCVSKKIYNDLENKYTDLKKENHNLTDENEELKKAKNGLETDKASLESELAKLKAERDKLQTDCAATANNLKTLQASYNALEKNSNDALESNMNKNRELLAQLDAKEKALAAEQNRLNKLRSELESSSKRLNELESMIAAKDAAMNKLKETLSKALNAFEGKGLTVEEKNGKVYVSLEAKLLFASGSTKVEDEGKRALVELAKVLETTQDIEIVVEGHTDTDRLTSATHPKSNWELSVLRATSVIDIMLKNSSVKPEILMAAGRSEFHPVDAQNKAKNRRIEIIIAPNLDKLFEILNAE
mgnify:CR=1 FL=1